MSKRSGDLLWPFECRTCHDRAALLVTDISDPENFQVVHRCGVCGYLNVFSRHRVVLPIPESLQNLTASNQESIRAALAAFCVNPTRRALRIVLDDYVQHLAVLVKQQPQEAAAALLIALRERERALIPLLNDNLRERDPTGGLFARVVSRCTDLLYLLLRQYTTAAPHLLVSLSETEAVRAFFRVFSSIASDAATLALQSHLIDADMWRIAAVDGSIVVESTDIHDRVTEWDLNRRQFDSSADASHGIQQQTPMEIADIYTEETNEAERVWLGFGGSDILGLIAGLHDKEATHELEGGIWTIDAQSLRKEEMRLLQLIVLDPSRTQRFEVPFYFDLGVERPAQTPSDAASRVLMSNWTNYYPIYAFDTEGSASLLTTKMPLIICLGNMETFRNRIFRRIADVAVGTANAAKLADLDKRLMRRLEDAVAHVAKQSGWHTLLRLKKDLAGRALECGEIDLLCAKVIREKVVLVVLAEVKDLDLTPITWPGGLAGMQSKLGHAFSQLSRRSQWLSSAWVPWLKELIFKKHMIGPSTTYLLPLVVTARYMPPFLFDQYVGVPLGGFGMFLAGLENGDLDRLRAIAGDTLAVLETT